MSRALPRQRRQDPEQEPAAKEAAQAPPAANLLALQRTAGNRAVGNLLRQAPGGLVQRDRRVGDDADTLGELGPAVLKDLVVDEDTISISGRAALFKQDRLPARPGINVDVRFGGPMAAADKSKEDALQKGLGSMALMMFGLDGQRPRKKGEEDWGKVDPGVPAKQVKQRPPTTDLVHIMDMDLTTHGGQDGHYRFAAVATKGKADAPTEVVIIVELLGARRKPFDATLDSKRKSALQQRFDGFGFVKKDPLGGSVLDAPDDTMQWLDDQWNKVLQALALVPDPMLAGVGGIVWMRGHGALGPSKEAGHYVTKTGLRGTDKPERALTLYDDTFKSDDTILKTIVHELGHAISEKPAEPQRGTAISAGADYQRAATLDGKKAMTTYGQKNWEEHYAESYSMFIAEPGTMKVMRPNEFAWFEKQQKDASRRP